MGAVTKEMENLKTRIWSRRTEIHCNQAIVVRFNSTLAEHLFGYQYGVEMRQPSGQQWTAWVKRLPEVFSTLNNKVTRLIEKKTCQHNQREACVFETLNFLFEACWGE